MGRTLVPNHCSTFFSLGLVLDTSHKAVVLWSENIIIIIIIMIMIMMFISVLFIHARVQWKPFVAAQVPTRFIYAQVFIYVFFSLSLYIYRYYVCICVCVFGTT